MQLASRRRRRKGIGKVLTSVERKVRRIEKRPGAKRLKNNVVTTEKVLPRSIVTKKIATDAVTANEAEFGVPVISDTEPTENLKEGTLWVDPTDGATEIYSTDSSSFIPLTDATAQSIAASKNTTYVQISAPTGGTYSVGDLWIDIDDGNKLYSWSGSAWVDRQDTDIAFAQATADGKNTIYRQTTAPTGGTYTSGDLWFDTDDNNKIYRFNGTNWNTAVQLGGNALANVNANSITAGTIDASVITVSNINAGNITTGKIDTGLITVSTNPTATGNTARVEVNSLGFYAYNGSVATVSITNTGTAVFSGTVNANGGNFTGYVTGGTMRFGADVNSTNDGIYINANNYWYDTGAFKVGDGSESMTYSSAGGLVVTGEINANSGTFSGTITATGTITGGTISGAVFETNSLAGGRYIRIEGTGTSDRIFFYNTSSFTSPGYIAIRSDSTLDVVPPYTSTITNRLTMLSGSDTYLYGGATDSYFRIGTLDAYISKNTQIAGTLTVTSISLTNSGLSTSLNVKKIRATSTSGTPTGGADGDIVIVYT